MIVESYESPFRHWVFDDVEEISPIRNYHLPLMQWPGWVHYNNDCEKKKHTTNKIGELHEEARKPFVFLRSDGWLEQLKTLTGIESLCLDPIQWGSGLQLTDPGGWLNCHIDHALHPSGLERRINVVAFLNDHWEESWGGRFELWDDSARTAIKGILPKPRRMIVWESSDLAYHSTEKTSLSSFVRITAAAWYLAPARPGCTRKRALFVPKREPS